MKLHALPPSQPLKLATLPTVTPTAALDADIKAQPMRLLDVGVFGPLTVLGALNKEPPDWMRLFLLFFGLGTIAYNAYNFLEIEKRRGLQHPTPPL